MERNRAGFRQGPGGMGMGLLEKPKNTRKTLRAFLGYLKPHRASFLLVAILGVLSTTFAVISPRVLGKMTDVIVGGVTHGGIDFGKVGLIGMGVAILYAVSALFTYLLNWILAGVSQKITYNFRRDISLKIPKLPLRYLDRTEKGNIISRVTNDVETISQNLNQGLTQMLTASISVIGILIIMFTISWQMTLISLGVLAVSFVSTMQIIGHSQKNFGQQQKALGEMDGHIEEMFSNHVIVKAFNGESRSVRRFNEINQELFESSWKSQFISGLMMPLTMMISNLGYVAAAVVGAWLAIAGRVSIGDIQAFIQYMNQFTQPIAQVANISNVFQSTIAAAERIFEFLNEPEERAEQKTLPAPRQIAGGVEFQNVYFGYEADKPVIKNFSVRIEPKCNVAIVGPTGAGKTTIVNLLMRFYDVDRGAIRVDGEDIGQMKRKDVRQMFGMVLQDTWLFNGTIAENIAFGRTDATREEIVTAAKEAHADHFIRTLPDGYDTVIGDSIDNISAGEKQLLTIARAFLANAPMLILDEATSAIDTRTEQLIQSAMDKLMRGRTSFVIAHRLSTIRNAEKILVMRDGNIVEHGGHEELLAQGGFYANLYNSQF